MCQIVNVHALLGVALALLKRHKTPQDASPRARKRSRTLGTAGAAPGVHGYPIVLVLRVSLAPALRSKGNGKRRSSWSISSQVVL